MKRMLLIPQVFNARPVEKLFPDLFRDLDGKLQRPEQPRALSLRPRSDPEQHVGANRSNKTSATLSQQGKTERLSDNSM